MRSSSVRSSSRRHTALHPGLGPMTPKYQHQGCLSPPAQWTEEWENLQRHTYTHTKFNMSVITDIEYFPTSGASTPAPERTLSSAV